MQLRKTLPLNDDTVPLAYARGIPKSETRWVLLYSSMKTAYSGRYSYLCLTPNEEIKASDFKEIGKKLSSNHAVLENAWFGYLGYGLKDSLERLPKDIPPGLELPDLWMVTFRLILVFDHEQKIISMWSKDKNDLNYIPQPIETEIKYTDLDISELHSNMVQKEYLRKVHNVKEAILAGSLYQANLTRKFYGRFLQKPNPLSLFEKLCTISPSPYSAFMQFGDTAVLSSSPERFITIDTLGTAETRPIKGSIGRGADETLDAVAKSTLQNSEKDKSENLMIVDLMRNDFSRGSTIGSVHVKSLFDVTSYASIHHMASTVTGVKYKNVPTIEFVANCFPPGSMTGAPKIRAIELCTELEQNARGIYSGAMGWFGGDGSADLSVIIRTLIIQGDRFEFQAGGGITADSHAEAEHLELLTKLRPIATVLGISEAKLDAL